MPTNLNGFTIFGAIEGKWLAAGAQGGVLGLPTSNETPTFDGVGRFQTFHGGVVSWHPEIGAFFTMGSICARWRELGSERFGYPTVDESPAAHGPGRYNTFRAMQLAGHPEASIYWSPDTGAHEVYGAIRDRWSKSGWENGPMGYPVSPEGPTFDGVGRSQAFQGGAISWHPELGPFMVQGLICARWRELGGERRGDDVTDETASADGVGRFSHFRAMQLAGRPDSSIFWKPDTGAHEVIGAIRARWAALGWERGPLAYPVSPEGPTFDGVGRSQAFQGGAFSWHPEIGAFSTLGLICARWRELGGEQFGYPVTDETTAPDGTGRFNHFRAMQLPGHPDSSIYWAPGTGAHEVYGGIRDRWAGRGWERGPLGYPVDAEHDRGDAPGREQPFQNGRIVWSPEGGALCDPLVFRADIVSGGLAALGGNFSITVNLDGSTVWQGHAHDSGADGYDFGISAVVRSPAGVAIAVAHQGSVGGTFTSGSRNHDWNEPSPASTSIRNGLLALNDATMDTNLNYSSDFASLAESLLSFAVKAVIGTVTGSAGLVIFLGVEAGSLLATGSLVPGARVIEGVLWLAGPANTLYALAAAGIARVGSNSRELTQEEYDWANNEVFKGALPPKDKLRLTDTIGPDDRAFTFPTFDGKIDVNMGAAGMNDPRKYPHGNYGQTFIHELVHSCQIEHSSDLSLIAEALSAKACEVTGKDPYVYAPAPLDYKGQNLEQQAQIVSDWYAGSVPPGTNQTGVPKDIASSYFEYIVANVRIGNF